MRIATAMPGRSAWKEATPASASRQDAPHLHVGAGNKEMPDEKGSLKSSLFG
jgi:hypothetical protein